MSEPIEVLFRVRISSKGQVVIPKHIREALSLNQGDELALIPTKQGILMKRPSKEVGGLRGLLKGLDVDIAECEAILGEASRRLVKSIGWQTNT